MRTSETTMTASDRPRANALAYFTNLRNVAVGVGFIGAIGLAIAAFTDTRVFWASYFFAYIFWLTLSLGSLTLTLLHHTIRGSWGVAILRVIEAGNKTLPLMFVLFLPIAYAMWSQQLYIWSNPIEVAKSELLQHKALYLNKWAWTIRAAIFWAFWIGISWVLNKSSLRQDVTHDDRLAAARTNLAAPGGVLFVVTLTFAITDWVMSLEPAWFSTIYGVWFMISSLLAALALGTLVVTGLGDRRPYSEVITPALTKDLGNLLLGFTMFWTYCSLSQFLIIWSGNLPEEVTFYINRFNGPLVYIGAFLIVAQFFIPFLCLLAGRTKRTPHLLRNVAAWILVVRLIDVFWQVTPFFRVGLGVENLGAVALDLGAFAALGAIWISVFVAELKKHPLLPAHDTRLQERALEGAHH